MLAQTDIPTVQKISQSSAWKGYEKVTFRIAFVFFIIQCVPTDLDWYAHALEIDWTNLHFRDLYHIARFEPGFIKLSQSERFGIPGFTNWGIVFLVSLLVATAWTFGDRNTKEYNKLYYWLKVIVRYRVAIGIIGFCWEKVFPMQMPYPTISQLSNDFGDYTPYKIYWLSIGIVPWYQVFAGLVELAGGAMLFFRPTVALGSALLIGALTSVGVVNIAYGNASHVYSFFFSIAGLFLLASDIPRIYNLLILERYTVPRNYYPKFSLPWQKYGRLLLKYTAIIVFCPLFAWLTFNTFLYDPYKQPPIPGVKGLKGYYNVTEFKRNGQSLPYSPLDSIRWQEAVFEKWPSFAIKVNRPIQVDLSNGGGYDKDHSMRSIGRAFELSGAAGGRRVFHYYADTITQTLYLLDKSIPHRNLLSKAKAIIDTTYPENWISAEAWKNIGDERTAIHPGAGSTLRNKSFAGSNEVDHERQKMVLRYHIESNGSRIILTGTDDHKDSIYVVLDRVNRDFTLSESSVEAGNYQNR